MLVLLGGALGDWRAISSRILCAKIKLRQNRSRREVFVSVISVYAPIYISPQEQKDKFYYDLQQGADSVPENHLLLILRDFNVRLGSSYS